MSGSGSGSGSGSAGVISGVGERPRNMRERAGVFVEAGVAARSDAARVFGGWMREVREKRGLDQISLAEKLGCSGSIIATWEGGNGLPGAVSMRSIAKWAGSSEIARMKQMVVAAAADGGGIGVSRETVRAERAGSGEGLDGLLDAIMACGLTGRQRAMLSAAVIAMAGGIDVRVEMVARN